MEKIITSICSVAIDKDYKSFNEAVKMVNTNDDRISKENIDLNDIYDQILVISDENVYRHEMKKFISSIQAKYIHEYIVTPGETSKSLEVYEEIMNYCIRINLSRKSLIVALGGGVVGDLAGFVASTYMRGIDVIQVPTSLLAQVDSSIGGKTGINLGNFKNIMGSFYQPKLTYINVNSLKSLPEEEFIGGMAEVIKYSAIYDYDFLDYLIENSEAILNKDEDCLYNIVKKCAAIKVDVVSNDEKEGGLRKILNFGHTFGHGVEKLLKISHGKSVSIGMAMAFNLALDEKLISKEYYEKFMKAIMIYNLPLKFDIDKELDSEHISKEILYIMRSDKKNSFGKINLILPTDLGKVSLLDNISEEKILNIIRESQNA